MRRVVLIAIILVGGALGGCRISRHIVDLTPPPDQPDLGQLESHLNYADPDAGQPDYVRTD